MKLIARVKTLDDIETEYECVSYPWIDGSFLVLQLENFKRHYILQATIYEITTSFRV